MWRGAALHEPQANQTKQQCAVCHNRGTAGFLGCDAIVFPLGDPPSCEQTSCDAQWEPYFVLTRVLPASWYLLPWRLGSCSVSHQTLARGVCPQSWAAVKLLSGHKTLNGTDKMPRFVVFIRRSSAAWSMQRRQTYASSPVNSQNWRAHVCDGAVGHPCTPVPLSDSRLNRLTFRKHTIVLLTGLSMSNIVKTMKAEKPLIHTQVCPHTHILTFIYLWGLYTACILQFLTLTVPVNPLTVSYTQL